MPTPSAATPPSALPFDIPGFPGLPPFSMPPSLDALGPLGAFAGAAQRGVESLGGAIGDAWQAMAGLNVPVEAMTRIQADYVAEAARLWNDAVTAMNREGRMPLPAGDRRFSAKAWADNPMASLAAQVYLLNARALMQLAESVEGDPKTRARIRFLVQQWIDATSPANSLAFNAEALAKAVETGGQSLAQGMQQLLSDLQRGHISQTDETAFEVGRNMAVTEGAVVFENELLQLIEYKPLTARVHERPMLFVPPCINKYYILDLQPENSIIRYTLEQGHRLFVVSWRNPDASMAATTWDDYMDKGPIEAIAQIRRATGAATVNTMGFCVGGTILTTALAVLAARGEHPAHSTTLFTTLLDFAHPGMLEVFIDEPGVRLREMTIGADAPGGPGMLKGRELATTFNILRPNDLVWNYVASSYLKGEAPPAFDLLYWNGDSTNLPGPMYCWYLRHMYLQNDLRRPGALTVCGEKIDLGTLRQPFFLYASREDHIVPWDSAWTSTQVLSGAKDQTFVLGASGHIAGVINPASKNKRSHWVNAKRAPSAAEWLDGAQERPGSWWPVWADWLAKQGGRMVAAPKAYGGHGLKAIEPAPGRYVRAKAE